MMKNAIILAAEQPSGPACFPHEKPRGVLCVRGEVLIERQIAQLRRAGVTEIYVVVGYMKERFFYLEQKCGVRLLVNDRPAKRGDLYSLYVAREHLADTYLCWADHYFLQDPFAQQEPGDRAYRVSAGGSPCAFGVTRRQSGRITGLTAGGREALAVAGYAYLNEPFSRALRQLMEAEIREPGVAAMPWEAFCAGHAAQLPLYVRERPAEELLEVTGIGALQGSEPAFLCNVDPALLDHICETLHCAPREVGRMAMIRAGLTNVSFTFVCRGRRYVYRHPGGTAEQLVDRQTEWYAQLQAKRIGIDGSVLRMTCAGWKLSHYVQEARSCDYERERPGDALGAEAQLAVCMEYLHRLHRVPIDPAAVRAFAGAHHAGAELSLKEFDDVAEGKRLMRLASITKGDLLAAFAGEIAKAERLYAHVQADAARLGYGKVLCHNDAYAPNFLMDAAGTIFLIDWEYAGINYGANDICCILCRYDWTEAQTERYLRAYVGHALSAAERRFYHAFIPICGFYWFAWGLYKGSVGDDDGFFFLPAYRNFTRYIDEALESYER